MKQISAFLLLILLSFGKSQMLNVREWGVMVIDNSGSPQLISNSHEEPLLRPLNNNMVREPVIYFDAVGIDSLSVTVQFSTGRPTISFPEALYSEENNELRWDIQFDSSHYELSSEEVQRCFQSTVEILNEVEASPFITEDSVRARSLFYEGEMSYDNKVSLIGITDSSIVIRNDNDYTLYDIFYVMGNYGENYRANLAAPGECELLRSDIKSVVSPFMEARFPRDEIDAFTYFWNKPVFGIAGRAYGGISSETYRDDAHFFYRLPEPVIDSLLPLSFSHTPDSITRVLHILAY